MATLPPDSGARLTPTLAKIEEKALKTPLRLLTLQVVWPYSDPLCITLKIIVVPYVSLK